MCRELRTACRGLCGYVGLLSVVALGARVASAAPAAEPVVDCVEVATRAPNNACVKVWYRVPRRYDVAHPGRWRVLVLFGGRNADGRPEVSGKLGWTEWADQNGIFLVAPTLRDDAYWEPKAWSGRALLDALALLAAKYRIAQSGVLYYGYSAGSQASNLFPAWRPDLCRAYVSHACGVFHAPFRRMRDVAGLVTCGDADTARYVLSRQFVGQYRALGIPIVWKSFPNHPHDVPPGSIALAQAFLAHAHWSHPEDLGGEGTPWRGARFVGDDADGVYYRADSEKVTEIMPEDRIELPSAAVAAAWGVAGESQLDENAEPHVEAETRDGVEVVSLVPKDIRDDSRILVLLGGRNWAGQRAIDELGFRDWAMARRWCILAPSFWAEDYWRPEGGSAEVIVKAVDRLRKRYGLRPLPVFMFGYSAGGQLTTLLQRAEPKLCAAWAAVAAASIRSPPGSGAGPHRLWTGG